MKVIKVNHFNCIVVFFSMFLFMVACKESTDETDTNQEVPAGNAIVLQDYNGWDEIRTSEDGSTFFNKYHSSSHEIETTLFLLRGKSDDVYCGFVQFDENEMPHYLYFNDIMISVDSCYDDMFNASVIVGDTLVYSLDSLSLPNGGRTRSFSQNNWVRNTCDVGQILMAALSAGQGAVTILGGFAGSAPTLGSSLLAIGSGTAIVEMSINDGFNAWSDLVNEKYSEQESVVGLNVYFSSTDASVISGLIQIANSSVTESCISKLFPESVAKVMNGKDFNVASLLASISFSAINEKFGKTVTTEESIRERAEECQIITGKATKITETTARLNGYVSGASVQGYQTRYGFVVSSNEGKVNTTPIDNGIGESFFVDCTELSEGTEYQYFAYVWDYTHRYIKFGMPRSFKTNGRDVPVTIRNVRVKKSSWDENNYVYKGHMYSYKFDCAVTAELLDDENVREWGYVYEDPNGERIRINMSSSNGYYTDERYVYYREEPISTLKLCGYVKYDHESDYRYGELKEYALEYEEQSICPDSNHPHMIDLGTDVYFSCCNMGAFSPEDDGGLYVYGDPTGTLYINSHVYDYSEWIDELCSHPVDISGTKYDIVHEMWGNGWRTPSHIEGSFLYYQCKWVWTKYKGRYGYKVIGPNGYHIFAPAAGSIWVVGPSGSDIGNPFYDVECSFWLSDRFEYPSLGWYFYFISKYAPTYDGKYDVEDCFSGYAAPAVQRSIRPVIDKWD